MTRKSIVILSIAVSAVLLVSLVVMARGSDDIRVTASSGSDPLALLTGERGDVAWRTDSETVGAWVELAYPRPTQVDHVEVLGGGGVSTGPASAVLTFDGGGSLLVTADDAGDAAVAFPERTVSRVRLTVAEVPPGATSVSLARLSVDGSGDPAAGRGNGGVVATSSSASDAPASALSDGTPAQGHTGAEWGAAPGDQAPWVQLSWPSAREVASVQVFGPTSTTGDGSVAPLRGELRFDDGSTVVVSGIAGGDDEATTLAFTPRMVSSVRLTLERTVPSATVGLREFAVYDVGTTPPRWPQDGATYSASAPVAESCDASSSSVAEPTAGRLTLVCPSPGSAVEGHATVVVATDPLTPVQALVWTGESDGGVDSVEVVASATAGADGRAVLSVDTSGAHRGPLTLRVGAATGAPDTTPLYVQLLNRTGRPLDATGSAPAGMTLQWAEEFTDPVSVSRTGADADYAAVKPDASSSGQFGEATFADPATGAGTLVTVDQDFLRIRARPADDSGYLAGLLASVDLGGAGFVAQYGYFEARILGAPGPGTWPAFWMLNTESAARRSERAGEVDVVELYGHNTLGSCHTVHSWGAPAPPESSGSEPSCKDENGFADWAIAWHTYAARITPNGATFWIDGLEVSTVAGLSHSAEPFFFLLDLALGGGWPVDLTLTAGTTDMYVDWVRVYT